MDHVLICARGTDPMARLVPDEAENTTFSQAGYQGGARKPLRRASRFLNLGNAMDQQIPLNVELRIVWHCSFFSHNQRI
jgi:hypothetical protein